MTLVILLALRLAIFPTSSTFDALIGGSVVPVLPHLLNLWADKFFEYKRMQEGLLLSLIGSE